MSDLLRLLLLLAALMGLGWAGSALTPAVRGGSSDESLNGASWEGRRLIAQFLWVKTHAVLHAGVEEREALPGEKQTRANEFHTHGSHGHDAGETGHGDEHDDDGHVFAIPPAREDFRGVLGDLERALKPYTDKNGKLYSKDADQTVPFYRIMTWCDPHFIQGYTIGATFIAKAGQFADRGLEFLLEGERNNPDSFEIQTELGRFYLVYRKDFPTAERHLRRAIALVPHRKLTELEDDSRMDAYHWLTLNYMQWGRPAEAIEAAREGLRAVGADGFLRRAIEKHGRI